MIDASHREEQQASPFYDGEALFICAYSFSPACESNMGAGSVRRKLHELDTIMPSKKLTVIRNQTRDAVG